MTFTLVNGLIFNPIFYYYYIKPTSLVIIQILLSSTLSILYQLEHFYSSLYMYLFHILYQLKHFYSWIFLRCLTWLVDKIHAWKHYRTHEGNLISIICLYMNSLVSSILQHNNDEEVFLLVIDFFALKPFRPGSQRIVIVYCQLMNLYQRLYIHQYGWIYLLKGHENDFSSKI